MTGLRGHLAEANLNVDGQLAMHVVKIILGRSDYENQSGIENQVSKAEREGFEPSNGFPR
jgi:hypothetical protein